MEKKDQSAALRRALASPLRLELLGLFSTATELSIADMAGIMGRPATSLYHHVSVLENLGVLQECGTRPKGKRHEKLYSAAGSEIGLEVDQENQESKDQLKKVMRSAFRMATKDFETALEESELQTEGKERNLLAYRIHMRCDPDFLAKVNQQLDALSDLIRKQAAASPAPAPTDHFLSITLALLPLPGRQADKDPSK